MMGADKDALLCDLAETYHIYSFEAVPIETLAVLSAGLHDDSRIKMRMAGMTKVSPSFSLVNLADTVTLLRYELRAEKNAPRPQLLRDVVTGKREKQDHRSFISIEEFEEARRRLINE